ncbi:hypothetical protein EXW59_00865 (plasmid) [Bacillus mycoides]|uniref:hypothetical protein n=1 Tax=Bacillus mycoides TaxID=1405 RepID=UPI001C02EA47|nr:hypothetical protein [Bacillus mycoides]QWH75460.1 hypothetical protein EXW59_00865 [Bacillus mycoides]
MIHVKHKTDQHPLIGKKAPIFDFSSYKNINKQLTKSSSILIFLDQDCIHCNSNIQNFLEGIQNKKNIDYSVVISKEQFIKAKEINSLYPDIPIMIVDKEVFYKYQISLFPSYVLINTEGIIKNITPVPFKVIV